MEYDDGSRAFNFLTGFVVGAALGAGAALLFAPQSGRRTRRQLREALDTARESAGEKWHGIAENLESAVETSRRRMKL